MLTKRTQIESFQQLYEADTRPNLRAQNLVDFYELQDMSTDVRRLKHPWVLETHLTMHTVNNIVRHAMGASKCVRRFHLQHPNIFKS
jgi:hypothetical protein